MKASLTKESSTKAPKNWIVKDSAQEVAEAVRDEIMQTATNAIQQRGSFSIVLAGGTTPENVYGLLAKESCDWKSWQIYLGDERCLPADDAERNSQMIQRCLLNKVDIPAQNIHVIPAEQGAEQAANAYQAILQAALPFDLVMLGMGEDGHTASLFSKHKHDENELVHAVSNAPKAPSERVSLSVKALSSNRRLLIVVTGESKKKAVQQWQEGDDLPVARISSQGEVTVYLDSDAIETI